MGDLQPGTNWYIRTDQKKLYPRSPQDFIDHNHQYTQQKLLKPRVDDHYAFMLEEIVQEVRAGRMNGPFKQPSSLPTPTIAPRGYDMDLLPLPRPSASSKPDRTAETRSVAGKIGAAAGTILHALRTINLSTTHQTTSLHWSYKHTNPITP